ncbi:MAG: hypothetical protein Q8M99_04845 [Methylotenera sp.]|nr:hypothetical protein [Methylotenera sp.]
MNLFGAPEINLWCNCKKKHHRTLHTIEQIVDSPQKARQALIAPSLNRRDPSKQRDVACELRPTFEAF